MEHVETLRTYLEMHQPPALCLPPPADCIAIQQLVCPTGEQYRHLYNTVGRDYNWTDRNRMADEDLRQILEDKLVEVYLLQVRGETAGYGELDRRVEDNIEVAYFGLFPAFVGQGLGKFFLNWMLHKAWSYSPARVWLHTCTLDHPAALPMYLSAGLTVFDRKMILSGYRQQITERRDKRMRASLIDPHELAWQPDAYLVGPASRAGPGGRWYRCPQREHETDFRSTRNSWSRSARGTYSAYESGHVI